MRLIIALVVLASCAHDLDELAPFPCPENNECPDGRVCAHEECVVPTLGSECHADFGDSCSAGEAATKCFELDPISNTGDCEHYCSSHEQCGSGYCSSEEGICLDDCSGDALACGLHRQCVEVSPGYRKCAPTNAPELGDMCSTDAQCKIRDAAAFCFKTTLVAPEGVCAAPCAADLSCPPASTGPRNCVPDHRSTLACLLACEATCETGFRCEMRGSITAKVCVVARLRADGQRCTGNASCATSKCGALNGAMRCTKSCSNDLGCSPGFACFAEEGSFGACWPQSNKSPGCATTRASSLMSGLGLLLILRRRRRSSGGSVKHRLVR